MLLNFTQVLQAYVRGFTNVLYNARRTKKYELKLER